MFLEKEHTFLDQAILQNKINLNLLRKKCLYTLDFKKILIFNMLQNMRFKDK